MAREMSMNGRKKIERIQKEFTEKFNYLTLIFLDEDMKSIDVSRSLAEVRTAKGPDISIMASLKVNTLEQRFKDSFGITVEVAYSREGKVMHTKDSVNKTLNELNLWCEKNGCDKFLFKKALTRNTLLSTQEQLFNAIRERFPDAVAKKINKDNFMDVHLPSVNIKRGTHLFFNTAKDGIKFGFYCRDEQFNNPILERSSAIEAYAQGVRPKGNPLFANVEQAAEAAIAFIGEMMGDSNSDKEEIGLSADEEMQRFLDNLVIDDSDDDEFDQTESAADDQTDDLENLIIKELPSKDSDSRLFEVNGKYTFTLGYDTKAYLNEDVVGIVPDELVIEALNSGDTWNDFIWNNGWSEFDSKVHNHGIIEPATHLELPSGERVEIKLKYETLDFDKQKIAFKNTSGKFVHISSSAEKSYGWDGWKKYSVNFGPGVFDTSKIQVSFDDDIVSGYAYDLTDTDSLDFTEDDSYETSGVGFTSELYFNNGKELVLIDMEELLGELEENNISKDDIKAIKKYFLHKITNESAETNNKKTENMATKKSTSTSKKKSSSDSTFKTVKIGKQEWMAENLNVDKFCNGEPIPQAITDEEWKTAGENKEPAWCYIENNASNRKKYGKLYNWYAVTDPRGLAPAGWHVPSNEEWNQLEVFLGNDDEVGNKMKTKNGWLDFEDEILNETINGNGTNESGFTAYPAGYRQANGQFDFIGNVTHWWTNTEFDNSKAVSRQLDNEGFGYLFAVEIEKNEGNSIRCLKN